MSYVCMHAGTHTTHFDTYIHTHTSYTHTYTHTGTHTHTHTYTDLDDSDWSTVCGYLNALDPNLTKLLGGELGLDVHRLEKMQDLPADMVRAWLRRDDKVTERCGDRLTWNVLVEKLREIGVTGVANDILTIECRQT